MLLIDVKQTVELEEALCVVYSGLLPHENFQSSFFMQSLNMLNHLIKKEELGGEHYVLISALNSIGEIKSLYLEYTGRLTRASFSSQIQANITELVNREEVRINELLVDNGLDTNLDVINNFDNACALLYNKSMDLYDKCFGMKIDTCVSISDFVTLKLAMISNIAMLSIRAQAQMLDGKFKFNRKVYSGSNDWLNFIKDMTLEIDSRMEDVEDNLTVIDNMDIANKLLAESNKASVPLADYGLPPMDAETPMMRHRYVVVVANENVGKTKFMINSATNCLLEGKKVLIMCGESGKAQLQNQIISNYIFKKFGNKIPDTVISKFDTLPSMVKKKINIALANIVESGNLMFIDILSYDNTYQELSSFYERTRFDALFIDHSGSLRGGKGDTNTILTKMSADFRNFRRENPIMLMLLSHLSAEAKNSLRQGKINLDSITAGSSSISKDADDILLLHKNPMLDKQGMVAITNVKRRGAALLQDSMMLLKEYSVSGFVWNDSLQTVGEEKSVKMDKIEEVYGTFIEDSDNEESYGDYDDDDDYDYDDSPRAGDREVTDEDMKYISENYFK